MASDFLMDMHYGRTHMGLHIDFYNRCRNLHCMDEAWRKILGARIRDIRKARQWNQSQLSETVGVHQSIISDIENGADFKVSTLVGLCRAFSMTPTALVSEAVDDPLSVRLGSLEGQLVGLFRQLEPRAQIDVLTRLTDAVNAKVMASAASRPRQGASPDSASPKGNRRYSRYCWAGRLRH